jgi:hypothetical protein
MTVDMKELVGEKPFSENPLKARITAGVVYPSFVFPEHCQMKPGDNASSFKVYVPREIVFSADENEYY